MLLGRDEELSLLEELVGGISSEGGRIVLVRGENVARAVAVGNQPPRAAKIS